MQLMTKPKKQAVTAKKNINAWIAPEVVDAFHRSRRLDNRGVAQQVEVLLREALRVRGLLPPPDAPAHN